MPPMTNARTARTAVAANAMRLRLFGPPNHPAAPFLPGGLPLGGTGPDGGIGPGGAPGPPGGAEGGDAGGTLGGLVTGVMLVACGGITSVRPVGGEAGAGGCVPGAPRKTWAASDNSSRLGAGATSGAIGRWLAEVAPWGS